MVLFALLAVPLEHAYGPLRIGIIFLASAFAANFMVRARCLCSAN
jgi:membrane associated rhomboid family serine protease